MTFTLTAFLLLCGCLCIQASAQKCRFILKSLDRYDLGDRFQLSAVYESSEDPHIYWQGFDVSPSETQTGVTTLELDKNKPHKPVYLTMGSKMCGEVFEVLWDLTGSGNRSVTLDLNASLVVPGTDLVYSPGTTLKITVAVEHVRGNGHLRIHGPNAEADFAVASFFGNNSDSFSIIPNERVSYCNVSFRESGNITLTDVTLKETDNKLINAWFFGSVRYRPVEAESSPVKELTETIELIVHDSGHKGPFPAGFLYVSLYMPEREVFTCKRSWSQCEVYCFVYADDIKEVNLHKENGQTKQVSVVQFSYQGMVTLTLDPHDPSTPGKYVCEASSEAGTRVKKTVTLNIE